MCRCRCYRSSSSPPLPPPLSIIVVVVVCVAFVSLLGSVSGVGCIILIAVASSGLYSITEWL